VTRGRDDPRDRVQDVDIELRREKSKVIAMLQRAVNYVEAYLYDYKISHRILTHGNPVILVIEIWWKKKRYYQLPLQEGEG